MAARFRNHSAFAEASVAIKADIGGGPALLVFSAMAVDTFSAAIDCIHRYAFARFDLADVCPDFNDVTRKFVPNYERDGSPGAWVRLLGNVQRAV